MRRKPGKLLLLIVTLMVWAGTSAIPLPGYTLPVASASGPGDPASNQIENAAAEGGEDSAGKPLRVCTALYNWIPEMSENPKAYLKDRQHQVEIALFLGFGIFHLCLSLLGARGLLWPLRFLPRRGEVKAE